MDWWISSSRVERYRHPVWVVWIIVFIVRGMTLAKMRVVMRGMDLIGIVISIAVTSVAAAGMVL